MGRVFGYRSRWIKDIAVTSANRKVGLIYLHPDLPSLTGLSRSFRVIAQTILTPEFFGYLAESSGKILIRVGLIFSRTSSFGEVCEVSVRQVVVVSA